MPADREISSRWTSGLGASQPLWMHSLPQPLGAMFSGLVWRKSVGRSTAWDGRRGFPYTLLKGADLGCDLATSCIFVCWAAWAGEAAAIRLATPWVRLLTMYAGLVSDSFLVTLPQVLAASWFHLAAGLLGLYLDLIAIINLLFCLIYGCSVAEDEALAAFGNSLPRPRYHVLIQLNCLFFPGFPNFLLLLRLALAVSAHVKA
jgi:hypothetical protein